MATTPTTASRTTHVVIRESGYRAGWFTQAQVDSGYVADFVAECNRNVPADPAHLEEIPEWPEELVAEGRALQLQAKLRELTTGRDGRQHFYPEGLDKIGD